MQQQVALLCTSALETALKQIMDLNSHLHSDFKILNGKVIEVRLIQLPWPLYFICNDEILVLNHYEAATDVCLNTDLMTLKKIHEGASLTELIKADKLHIDGDINVLQQFSNYLEKLEFNLIEPVSKYIGDVPAHLLNSGFSRVIEKVKSITTGTTQHLSELAIEEYKLAPHRIEYIFFKDQLEDLSSNTDTLEKRIKILKEQQQA